jgi:phosphoribosylglycinamide formyltransferase-1
MSGRLCASRNMVRSVDGRIVVLVSGSGSNMEALAAACDRDRVPGRVVAVVADRECLGIGRASARGIATAVCTPASFRSREEWSDELRAIVAAHRPDLVVSAGFMRILAPVFVDAFAGRLINLHPALLPAFPGPHAVRDALDYGAKVTGTTVHLIDHQVDHGPVLFQEPVEVQDGDTVEALHDRIKEVEHRLLPEACRVLLEDRVRIDGRRTIVYAEGGARQ